MARWLWIGVRLGINAGILSGVLVGLIAGVGGSLLTSSLPDLANFAGSTFLLTLAVLPLLFYVALFNLLSRGGAQERSYIVSAGAWLPALLASIVAFMMPVVMAPLLFGKGVTLQNSGDWYNQVFTVLLGWRVLLVAAVTAIGFAAAAYTTRLR